MQTATHADIGPSPRMQLAWWLSWRPFVTVGLGAALGFAVGNVLTTWTVRAAMLREGLAPVLHLLEPHAGNDGGSLLLLATIPVFLSLALGAVLGAGGWMWSVISTRQVRHGVWEDLRVACGEQTAIVRADTHRFHDVPTSATVVGSELQDGEVTVRTWTVSVPDREATLDRAVTIAADEIRDVRDVEEGLVEIRTEDARYTVPTPGVVPGTDQNALYQRLNPSSNHPPSDTA